MLLTITTAHRPASDLSYLLHKHHGRFQKYDLSFGKAHAFYTEAAEDRCAACLLLDVDPVGMVRGGERFLRADFEPLGYAVEPAGHPLDERFLEWGESPYFSATVTKETTLSELLTHLDVLVPVFDAQKHYFVGDDEMEKLLAKGSGWLSVHTDKEEIARRDPKFRPSLFRQALARLVVEEQPPEAEGDKRRPTEQAEDALERPLSLPEQRLGAGLAALRGSGATRVLDLGCREGKLLRELLKDKQFEDVVGMDVSIRSLEAARDRLKLDRMPERQAARLKLLHGSLIYRNRRLEGFEAAAVVEVVGHLDPPYSRPSSGPSSSSPGRGRSCSRRPTGNTT